MSIKAEDEINLYNIITADWELAYSCFSEVYRLYIQKNENQGFQAIAVYNPYSDNTKECWDNKDLLVNVIFNAQACFDGVRHLNINPYISHPCLDRIGLLIKELRKIEVSICPDAEPKIQDAW